jgi:pimeloyl-ACP methyl ester carboxylesterase
MAPRAALSLREPLVGRRGRARPLRRRGDGSPLLLLHGNPTWSFLYREVIKGLSDRFRCIAPDYPGFGLSRPPVGYGFTPAEHAQVLEQLVLELDLTGVTMMVQDWGGPIGFAVAVRHPERFDAFVVGNTWAWPSRTRRLSSSRASSADRWGGG